MLAGTGPGTDTNPPPRVHTCALIVATPALYYAPITATTTLSHAHLTHAPLPPPAEPPRFACVTASGVSATQSSAAMDISGSKGTAIAVLARALAAYVPT